MKVEKLICKENDTIKNIMMCIDKNGKGIVFIVDEKSRLVGVMTDGDIRRLLIDGYGLNDTVTSHVKKDLYMHTYMKKRKLLFKNLIIRLN